MEGAAAAALTSLLAGLGELGLTVLMAELGGGASVEDAVTAAVSASTSLPEREARGGDSTAGAWDRDHERARSEMERAFEDPDATPAEGTPLDDELDEHPDDDPATAGPE